MCWKLPYSPHYFLVFFLFLGGTQYCRAKEQWWFWEKNFLFILTKIVSIISPVIHAFGCLTIILQREAWINHFSNGMYILPQTYETHVYTEIKIVQTVFKHLTDCLVSCKSVFKITVSRVVFFTDVLVLLQKFSLVTIVRNNNCVYWLYCVSHVNYINVQLKKNEADKQNEKIKSICRVQKERLSDLYYLRNRPQISNVIKYLLRTHRHMAECLYVFNRV